MVGAFGAGKAGGVMMLLLLIFPCFTSTAVFASAFTLLGGDLFWFFWHFVLPFFLTPWHHNG